MIKGSGINYFTNQVGVSDLFRVFYTFESGQTYVPSISGGNPIYSGLVNGDTGVFWQKSGSGLFSGTYLTINQTGLGSESFSSLLSFEVLSTGKQLLISNLNNSSGYEIGLNDAHKLYFHSKNEGVDVYATSNINLSSKNLISVGYITNSVELGYYNFNSKTFEVESFIENFGQVKSDKPLIIGSGFTGYADYFLSFDLLINSDALNEITSGWCFVPTGVSYQTEEICTETITGYQRVPYFKTGFIGNGNSGVVLEFDGVGDFSGAFPVRATGYSTTGIIESGYLQSGLSLLNCVTLTGGQIILYETLTGYAASFGMDKAIIINHLDSLDLVKVEKEYTPFNNFCNKTLLNLGTGLIAEENLVGGNINLYLNGVAITNSGINYNNNIITSNQFSLSDEVIFDEKGGSRNYFTTGFNAIPIPYSGQQIFLNGQNLISGDGFVVNGGALTITGQFTGISGLVFEVPIVLQYETGNSYLWTGEKFARNGALVFLNGIRQEIDEDYLEGSNYDLLKSNQFNEDNSVIYDANGQFWE